MEKIILFASMAIATSVCEAQLRVVNAGTEKIHFVDVADSLKFVTLSESLTSSERVAVDLGLPSGTKWANMNVGAECAADCGWYIMWGYTEDCSKAVCSSSYCKNYGVDVEDWHGNTEYDAATKNWGRDWKTPTDDQISELISYCGFTWTVLKNSAGEDVTGVTVTGTNGNCIFLPAAGHRDGTGYGTDLDTRGANGGYWSSSPYESDTSRAYCLGIDFEGPGLVYYSNYRSYGFPIRPILAQ